MDAGVQTAFAFAKWEGADELLSAQVRSGAGWGHLSWARQPGVQAPATGCACMSSTKASLLGSRALLAAASGPIAALLDAPRVSLPPGAASAVQAGPRRVRSWAAREEWLALPDFSNCLHTPPYSALLNCDSWQARRGGWLRGAWHALGRPSRLQMARPDVMLP